MDRQHLAFLLEILLVRPSTIRGPQKTHVPPQSLQVCSTNGLTPPLMLSSILECTSIVTSCHMHGLDQVCGSLEHGPALTSEG